MASLRLGPVLVGRRLLDPCQVAALIDVQAADPRFPDQIAGEYFGLEREAVCEALAEQIIGDCPRVNLAFESIDANCRMMVTAEEAWNAMVLPMRVDDGVMVCATTAETLDRAIDVMQRHTHVPYRFVIVPIRQLEQYVCQLYNYEGLDINDVA